MKKITLLFVAFLFFFNFVFAQSIDTLYLWPGEVPNSTLPKKAAVISENNSGNVNRIAEVTNPLLVVYQPEKKSIDVSVIICPGGAYQILAIDKEGYEIAQWLNELGISAYVLQYRVPDNRAGALQDVQRAIRMVRKQNLAGQVGVMGFSAGGSLSARATTLSHLQTYTPVDAIDQLSAKPDFGALIYPAYLDLGENRSLTPEITITENTPTLFIFATADDSYSNSALVMTTAMRDHKHPVELHFLAKGGHGYGLRPGNSAGETWPALMEKWLSSLLKDAIQP